MIWIVFVMMEIAINVEERVKLKSYGKLVNMAGKQQSI